MNELCCTRKFNEPYVQCDCPVHDFVAELIGVRSTRENGYDPDKKTWPEYPARPRKPKEAQRAVRQLGLSRMNKNHWTVTM